MEQQAEENFYVIRRSYNHGSREMSKLGGKAYLSSSAAASYFHFMGVQIATLCTQNIAKDPHKEMRGCKGSRYRNLCIQSPLRSLILRLIIPKVMPIRELVNVCPKTLATAKASYVKHVPYREKKSC